MLRHGTIRVGGGDDGTHLLWVEGVGLTDVVAGADGQNVRSGRNKVRGRRTFDLFATFTVCSRYYRTISRNVVVRRTSR